ncbi:MAG: hypothetical protein LBC59_06770 [Chitinispirillales bacterium]|jgi:hypothetical protein|nr:hypothetical protein [Chitinispirillales bacterium]
MTDQELKDLVASLAEDRKKSREEFEKSREEFDRRMKESREKFDRRMEETARVMEELGRKVDKVCGKVGGVDESGAQVDRQLEKTARTMEELGRKVDKVCGKMGGIDENLGYHAELFFQDAFRRKKVFGGVRYDYIDTNTEREGDSGKMEVDIMLYNGDSVALIEVKNRIHPNFVKEFANDRVKKFRTLYPDYDDYKLYLGIAAFSFDKKVLEEAKTYGVGIVKQLGEGIEVEADGLKAY